MHIFVNEHIHVSEFRPADTAALVEHLNDWGIYERTLRIPFPYTEPDAEKFLALVERSTQEQGQPLAWAIRDEQNRLIGGLGFEGLEVGKSHRAEIGYWLAGPYLGGGIMTAVVQRVCAFAFAEFRLVKITAHVFAGNTASARVLEKCGFEAEGFLKKHYLKDGQFLDAIPYALLK